VIPEPVGERRFVVLVQPVREHAPGHPVLARAAFFTPRPGRVLVGADDGTVEQHRADLVREPATRIS
jgi:hypothetical protein